VAADTPPPPLHPVLVALTIVLKGNEDLGNIKASHLLQEKHNYYQAEAKFPDNLSDLLPEESGHWWEHLGKSLLLRLPYRPTYNL
jgi:hypothetical protein